jgi:cell shape-determining protein MreD
MAKNVDLTKLPEANTMVSKFTQIFKDNNDWNEKTIIGFMSFTVMVIVAAIDLITGLEGKSLEIKEYIYNSFMMLTIGSFGIAGLEKFSPSAKVKAEAQYNRDEPEE